MTSSGAPVRPSSTHTTTLAHLTSTPNTDHNKHLCHNDFTLTSLCSLNGPCPPQPLHAPLTPCDLDRTTPDVTPVAGLSQTRASYSSGSGQNSSLTSANLSESYDMTSSHDNNLNARHEETCEY